MATFDFDFKEFREFVERFGKLNAEKASNVFMDKALDGYSQYIRDKSVEYSPTGSYGGAVNFTTRGTDRTPPRDVSFNATSSRTGGLLARSWHFKDKRKVPGGSEVTIVNDASVMVTPDTGRPWSYGVQNSGRYYYANSVNYGYTATTIDRLTLMGKNPRRPVKETPVAGQFMLERAVDDADNFYIPSKMRPEFENFLARYLGGS